MSASNTVFVLTPTKLYSLDDGEIWSAKALPESVVGFALLTATDSVLYIRSGTGALWRSGNKGQTWETVSVPNSFQGGAYNILASGNHLALVYNVSIHGFQYATHFIYSFDAGKTFSNNIGPISNNRSNFTQNVALIDNRIFLWLVDPLTVESNLYRSNILSPIATPVSAANYQIGSLASESIASVFGTGLALKTASANGGTLPTNLENTTVTITDNVGNIKAAPLFYVSPTQINFQLPTGLANGVGIVSISLYNQTVATGVVAIANTAPGLFSANQTGAGLAAANVQRVAANGASTYQPIAQFDAAAQKFVALPINVNAGLDQAYLNLYGTGIRGRSDLATVKATIGGTVVPVTYAGPHGSFVGVDQINILLPSTLRGKGENEIILTVDNQISNKVKIVIQ